MSLVKLPVGKPSKFSRASGRGIISARLHYKLAETAPEAGGLDTTNLDWIIEVLMSIAKNGKSERSQLHAMEIIFDRMDGKPAAVPDLHQALAVIQSADPEEIAQILNIAPERLEEEAHALLVSNLETETNIEKEDSLGNTGTEDSPNPSRE